MKRLIGVLPCIALSWCGGCEDPRILPAPPPVHESLQRMEARILREARDADGTVWYDPTKTVFKFATRVRFVDGFYEGYEGLVVDWNTDGYTVRVAAYFNHSNDPGRQEIKPLPTLRGVPESSLVAVEPSP